MKAKVLIPWLIETLMLFIALLMSTGVASADNTSPLCFTARNGSVTVRFEIHNITHSILYSIDGTNWNTYTSNTDVTIGAGQSVYFQAATNQVTAQAFGAFYWEDDFRSNSHFHFSSSDGGKVEGSGNIMSLYGPNCPNLPLQSYAFTGMFRNCDLLTTAPSLPATTLAMYCYRSMFSDCTSLIIAPSLSATSLVLNCYEYMFYGCTSLTTAPFLPATTLADHCYSCMFDGCTSLTTAPSLPATTLTAGCYESMFMGCTSLTTAPFLPATTLDRNCYSNMFYGCTSLTTAPSLPATTLADYCYSNMFDGCTSLTTAPLLPATILADHCYSCMFDGCTSLTAAPSLPATTLVDYCYYAMFSGCTSLVVNTSAPGRPWRIQSNLSTGPYDTANMFAQTGGTMSGTPNVNTTYYIASASTQTHSLTVNVNDSTMGNVSGGGTYYAGDVAYITANSIRHYHFARWSDGNTSNPRNITVNRDLIITAIFEIDKHNIIATATNGIISGTGEYDYGSTALLTAIPDDYYCKVNWSDGDSSLTKSFTVAGDVNFTAEFEKCKYIISATCEHGTVTGGGIYENPDVVTLTALVDDGYRFVKWSDDNEYNPRVFVVRDDLTVEAICEEAPVIDDVENVEADAPAFYIVGSIIYNPDSEPLRVYSAEGKLIKTSDSDINMECYPKGIYMVVDTRGNTIKVPVQ